jgi:hypothetical protein
MDARTETETLSSFVVDLPPASHAIAVLEGLRMQQAVDACRAVARTTRERVVVGGGPRSEFAFARSLRADLVALVAQSRRGGASGVLLVVDAAQSSAAFGAGHHVGAERAHGHHGVDGLRVLCVYDRALVDALDRDSLIRASIAHDDALTPEGLA